MTHNTQLCALIRGRCRPLQPRPTDAVPRLTPLNDVRAVLFDVYGTLLVSGSGDVGTTAPEQTAERAREAFVDAGLVPRDRTDDTIGQHAVELLRKTIDSHHQRRHRDGVEYPEVDIRDVWTEVMATLTANGDIPTSSPDTETVERLAVAYECRVNPVWPMPGMRSCLQRLADAPVRVGIVSNAQFYTPLMFAALVGRPPEQLGFEPALCEWSFERREAKPSPRLFERVLARLRDAYRIDAGAVVYVGNDRRNDVWPAATLGLRTVLFAGDSRSLRLRTDDPCCRDVIPDAVITHLGQLRDVLPMP